MKKVFIFAAIAALFASCSEEQLATQNVQAPADDNTVNFSVYTPRSTRAGTPGDITNVNIKEIGFGVFAYYTANDTYSANATPNFMYNQKVTFDEGKSEWVYEPVKYWPNEYGDAAISDETDRVSFFAYAPYVEFIPTKGTPDPTGVAADKLENYQTKNIIKTKANNGKGDPIINYVVDTDPATSVDLLWGVNADPTTYAPIGGNDVTQNVAGLPFIDLVKPANPLPGYDQDGNRIKFNLRHALAKVKVTIDYIADAYTPAGESEVIDADETRIYVRNITMNGFAMEGALNLNNTEVNDLGEGIPLWKDVDGDKDLKFGEIMFNDGRKDGKEGVVNGEQKNEPNQDLNPVIVENNDGEAGKFGTSKTPGVTNESVLLFKGDAEENDGFFYVIPRNAGDGVNVTIAYDVETIDPKLAGKLSDNETYGSSIENVISKENIFGEDVDFEAGKQYEIHIHLGMTSVKIDAKVTDWDDSVDPADVDLPDNQDGETETANGNKLGTKYNYITYSDADKTAQWGAGIATITGIEEVDNATTTAKTTVLKITAAATEGESGTFYAQDIEFTGDGMLIPIFATAEAAAAGETPFAYVELSKYVAPEEEADEDALAEGDAFNYHAWNLVDNDYVDWGTGVATIQNVDDDVVTVQISGAANEDFNGKLFTVPATTKVGDTKVPATSVGTTDELTIYVDILSKVEDQQGDVNP